MTMADYSSIPSEQELLQLRNDGKINDDEYEQLRNAMLTSTQSSGQGHESEPKEKSEQAITAAFSEDSVWTHFKVIAISWWIGYPICIIGGFLPEPGSLLLSLIWIPALIVSTVFWCILLYRQWSLLQGHGARTTPGKAVGFGFIPFYSFYWWFVAYAGLATDTNNYLKAQGVTSVRMSFGLTVTDCILGILAGTIGLIPKVGAVIMVPAMIVGFILVLQQRDCVLAIIKNAETLLQPDQEATPESV